MNRIKQCGTSLVCRMNQLRQDSPEIAELQREQPADNNSHIIWWRWERVKEWMQ